MSETSSSPQARSRKDAAFCPERLDRRCLMSTLALARLADLDALWNEIADKPTFTWLKEPQRGAAMVRARAGGTGVKFNLGEMTVTRCVLQLSSGEIGVAYVAGRSRRHAALAAVLDAMLQREAGADGPIHRAVGRLAREIVARRRHVVAEVAASKVDFSMLVQEASG